MQVILLFIAMPLMATAAPAGGVSTTGVPSSMFDWLFPHFERRAIQPRSIDDDVGLDNVSPVSWKRDFGDFGLGLGLDGVPSSDSSPNGLDGQLFKRNGGAGGVGGDFGMDGSGGGADSSTGNKDDGDDKDGEDDDDDERGNGRPEDPKGGDPTESECEEAEDKSDGSEMSEDASLPDGKPDGDKSDNKAHCLGNIVKPNSSKSK